MIRTGKERRKDMGKKMFGVAVVGLTESTVELPPKEGARIMG